MIYTLTVTTETATGKTVKIFTALADEVDEERERIRKAAPHGSTQTITVK